MKLKCNNCKVTEDIDINNGYVAWTKDGKDPIMAKGAGDGKWYHAYNHKCAKEEAADETG